MGNFLGTLEEHRLSDYNMLKSNHDTVKTSNSAEFFKLKISH